MPVHRKARQRWQQVHRVLGLGLGVVIALLGLTGSLLVYYLSIDAWLNPAMRPAQPASMPPSVQAVYQVLRHQFPLLDGRWRIELPRFTDEPVRARYVDPPERPGRFFRPRMLTLDPQTLRVTSDRYWGEYAVTWIYDLHYTLLAGAQGRTVVGLVGLAMVVSLVTGLYLWWPGWHRLARTLRPWPRPGRVRATWDLHVLAGVYGLVVLATLAVTGVCLALPQQARWLIGAKASPPEPAVVTAGLVATLDDAADLDAMVATARAALPDAQVRWVETAGAGGGAVVVRMHRPDDPGRRFPQARVWVHPGDGTVIAVRDPRSQGAGNVLWSWIHPLHNGEGLGQTGRALAFIGGLLPSLLLATGWLRWRQRGRAGVRRRVEAPRHG